MTNPVLAPPDFLVSARALMEYRGMFRLTNDELCDGVILDCPGGAASFAAEARRVGATVISADPIYARSHDEIAEIAHDGVRRTSETSAEHPEMFSWTFFRSIEHHRQVRSDACAMFLRDHWLDGEWYVPAALPRLPFADGTFSLTLSSHLVFTYDHLIDLDATVAALLELVRVTDVYGEVRVFPIVSAGGGRSRLVDDVRAALRARRVDSVVETVWYEAQRGGNELLRLRRRR